MNYANELASNPDCDKALKEHGIESLSALVRQYSTENLYDARNSYLVFKDNDGIWGTVANYAQEKKENVGAFVLNGLGPNNSNVTFLSYRFFDPKDVNSDGAKWPGATRAIMLIHEAVHQFGGKGDNDFGGSKALSNLIVDKCFPALKGQLGGVG